MPPVTTLPTSAALVEEVVRFHRIIQRMKQNPTGPGSADRSAHILLLTIANAGPMRLSDLATAVHVDASTVSRQAAQLVTEQLLERQPHPQDGRASVVALTDAGRAVVEGVIQRRQAFFEQAVQGWSEQDLSTFTALLHRFVDDTETTYASACTAPTSETSS
jgi:DNA-binding MarR family transcriptional regulator